MNERSAVRWAGLGWILVLVICLAAGANAQSELPPTGEELKKPVAQVADKEPSDSAVLQPAITSLADVKLGMTAEEVKDKLGNPDVQDKTGLVFTPDGRSIQIGLDAQGKVRTIAVIYTEGNKAAPTFEQIFGPSVEAPKADGNIYKMMRYPEAGFWLSYSVTNPDDKPITVVTMRRM